MFSLRSTKALVPTMVWRSKINHWVFSPFLPSLNIKVQKHVQERWWLSPPPLRSPCCSPLSSATQVFLPFFWTSEPLFAMFESVRISMVQGLDALSGTSPSRAPSFFADATARHVTQRPSRPAPKPSNSSLPSTTVVHESFSHPHHGPTTINCPSVCLSTCLFFKKNQQPKKRH